MEEILEAEGMGTSTRTDGEVRYEQKLVEERESQWMKTWLMVVGSIVVLKD